MRGSLRLSSMEQDIRNIPTADTILKETRVPSPATEKLYLSAFPEEERRPIEWWRPLFTSGRAHLFEIFENDVYAGFITLWNLDGTWYVEHFAIDESLRGSGIGSRVLNTLAEKGFSPMVLEVELEGSSEMADRRVAFYKRHGFISHPEIDYLQPIYAPHLPPVPMMLMTSGATPDINQLARLIKERVYKR